MNNLLKFYKYFLDQYFLKKLGVDMKNMFKVFSFFVVWLFFMGSAQAYQPFPDTGQVKCYNNTIQITCPAPGQPFFGQDYQYQPRLPRSYSKLGYGGVGLPDTALHVDGGGDWSMTRDNVTGLIWQTKTENTMSDTYSWTNANDVFIAELNREMFSGYSDWRLPTVKELSSIVDSGILSEQTSPKIDSFWFPNTRLDRPYWTANRSQSSSSFYWCVNFNTGLTLTSINSGFLSQERHVYAVRSGQSYPSYLVDNEDGTVTDPNTGLMWQKETAPGTYTWEQALAYANNLTLAGHSDWRLPNINELHTLVDYSRGEPAVFQPFANDTVVGSDIYWSSTSVASQTTGAQNAKGITLGQWGAVTSIGKSNLRYVRVVRAGNSAMEAPSSLADVSTVQAGNIKTSSAAVRGYIQDDGGAEIIEKRFEWGTTTSLGNTVSNSSIITDGGFFYTKLTGLLPNAIYYFRALARNSHGWSEGIIQSFTTSKTDQYQPFPDTGQAKCYDNSIEIICALPEGRHFGQDVQHQPRLPRSYSKLGFAGEELPDTALHVDEGGGWIMTRDNVTGLIWQIKTENTMSDTYSWTNARDVFIANLNLESFGGYSDWRLPTAKDLSSLVDNNVPEGHSAPKINAFWFPNTRIGRPYWTVDISVQSWVSYFWCVDFNTGLINAFYEGISGGRHVYAVRSGQSYPPNLVDNADGTITDQNTGLMWQKETAPGTYTWEQALAYANNLTLAGHSDWRLPNINELHTLVDYSRGEPAVFQPFANDTVVGADIYWSSTSMASQTTGAQNAKGITLGQWGAVTSIGKSNLRYVRVVRAGNSVPVGTLSSIIEPIGALHDGARWRILGSSDWKFHLYPERIASGLHRIEFKDLDQWITPEIKTVFVGEGEAASTSGTYARVPETGDLYVTIEPAGARADGARWRRVGTSTWRQSGQTETGVLVGQHTVEFRDIVGWNTPARRTVTIAKDQTAFTSGNYSINNSEYQVSADTGTPGGSVSGTGIYLHNQTVTLKAVPKHGWVFKYWTVNGKIVSTDAEFTFLATDDLKVIAHFEERPAILPGVMMLLLDDE
jgi:hypothetical protein